MLAMESLFGADTLERSWHGRSKWFWALVLLPFILLGACGWFMVKTNQALTTAERSVALFHERLAAGKYEAIYNSSVPALQEDLKKGPFKLSLSALHIIIPSCRVPAEPLNYFVNASTSGISVRLVYRSQCGKARLDEAFTFLLGDGEPRLAHYAASSPLFLHSSNRRSEL